MCAALVTLYREISPFGRSGGSQVTVTWRTKYTAHKVYTYKEYHSVCPLVGIETLPTPLSPAIVPQPLPPEPRGGGGAPAPAGEGLEESQFRWVEKKLALFLQPNFGCHESKKYFAACH